MASGSIDAPEHSARGQEGAGRVRLCLLGSFELRSDNVSIALPHSAERVLAFLALRSRRVHRVHVAGQLWVNAPEQRAQASLRSALWRLQREGANLVVADRECVRLSPAVDVDVVAATATACQIVRDEGAVECAPEIRARLASELLPDWYDDWLTMEREQYRQLGLHALEALSGRLAAQGRLGDALETALAAVANDPLRESAHRALIAVHLAEGNARDAIRQYELYATRLRQDLGLDPSPRLQTILRPLMLR